jgi:hypothetical protein
MRVHHVDYILDEIRKIGQGRWQIVADMASAEALIGESRGTWLTRALGRRR